MASSTHLTTRRGFIVAMGFGGVSLYGLWAAYGAAPGPLALLGLGGDHDAHPDAAGGAHGGHGSGAHGPTPEEFTRTTADFIERHRLPDGTVYPRDVASPDHTHGTGQADRGPVAGHAVPHGTAGHGDHGSAAGDAQGEEPMEVYLAAGKWYYAPARLRLDAGRPYRFRMMAVDVSHGASIQLGRGGRMVRLRPGRLTEMDVTFRKAGHYLVYCTVYCGPAHDLMQATIEVA